MLKNRVQRTFRNWKVLKIEMCLKTGGGIKESMVARFLITPITMEPVIAVAEEPPYKKRKFEKETDDYLFSLVKAKYDCLSDCVKTLKEDVKKLENALNVAKINVKNDKLYLDTILAENRCRAEEAYISKFIDKIDRDEPLKEILLSLNVDELKFFQEKNKCIKAYEEGRDELCQTVRKSMAEEVKLTEDLKDTKETVSLMEEELVKVSAALEVFRK